MLRLGNKTRLLLFMLLGCLLLGGLLSGCSRDDYMGMDKAEQKTDEPDTDSIAAENKTYGLSLPNAKKFGEILQDFIYWEYATEIGTDKEAFILNYLKESDFPETEVKIRLYYRECDKEEYDNRESNFYNIVAVAPENKALSDFTFEYNARGLSSDYECDYGTLVDEDENEVEKEDISPQELEKNISSWYTFFGETSISLKESEAKNYKVTDKFPAGEKEKILSHIRKAIKKQYKESDNTAIYIHDFLPGDERLSGKVIHLNITNKYDIPLFWINSSIRYSGTKMENFEGIYWDTHYSTGASSINDPTVEWVKRWAKEENNAVDIDKCILAYRLKNGKLIDLKSRN